MILSSYQAILCNLRWCGLCRVFVDCSQALPSMHVKVLNPQMFQRIVDVNVTCNV